MNRSVVIVEDNAEIKEGFRFLINQNEQYYVVNAYTTCEEALKNLEGDRPDIVLMDIDLPGMDGIQGTREIKRRRPESDIVIITVFENSEHVFDALVAGATGYLTKSSGADQLINALDEVASGGAPMSTQIAKMVVQSFMRNPSSPLSERETQILTLLAQGKSHSTIAVELFISKNTTKTHIKNIYTKLQVNSKAEAIAKANRDKII